MVAHTNPNDPHVTKERKIFIPFNFRVKYGVKYRYTRVNFPHGGQGLGSKKGALSKIGVLCKLDANAVQTLCKCSANAICRNFRQVRTEMQMQCKYLVKCEVLTFEGIALYVRNI